MTTTSSRRPGGAEAMREALEWYARQVAACRKITSEGEDARRALDRDGGKIAREALPLPAGDTLSTGVDAQPLNTSPVVSHEAANMSDKPLSTGGWNSDMEKAPRDGTVVDLWIEGPDNTVDYYAPCAKKVKNKPLRHGRAVEFKWAHKPPNSPNWYPVGGLGGLPLSPEVRPVAWMLPEPPPGE